MNLRKNDLMQVASPFKLDKPTAAISGLRIRFLPASNTNLNVAVHFSEPQPTDALTEAIDIDAMRRNEISNDDQLQIICVPDGRNVSGRFDSWTGDSVTAGNVSWQPGLAVIRASPPDSEILIRAAIEFSFYESELRKLEQAILPFEQTAQGDVALAYRMKFKNRPQWDRLYQTMENLQKLRLRFTRLHPFLHQPSASMPIEGRQIFKRVVRKVHVLNRLETLSQRLEACEDLYEGAVDRITDFRMYGTGNRLEWAIVFLLVAEVVLLILQMHHG